MILVVLFLNIPALLGLDESTGRLASSGVLDRGKWPPWLRPNINANIYLFPDILTKRFFFISLNIKKSSSL